MIEGVCGACASSFEGCAGCDRVVRVSELSISGFCPACQHFLSMEDNKR